MKNFKIFLLCIICMSLLAACTRKSDEQKETTKNESKILFPAKTSLLKNINGISIKYGERCSGCCDIEFDKKFGYENPSQLDIIIYLISSNDIEYDMQCLMPVKYYALDHLLFLSIDNQDNEAAYKILFEYDKMNLDGELAEDYVESRVLPVLDKFKQLDKLITRVNYRKLVEYVCAWYDTADEYDRKKFWYLISKFKNGNLNYFYDTTENCIQSGK